MPPKRDQQVANPTPMQVPANAEPYRENNMFGREDKVQEFKNHIRVTKKQTQSTKQWYEKK